MATSKKRKDNFKGKLGNTVSYPLNGQVVTREIGFSKKDPSIPQLTIRLKTKMITALLKPVLPFVGIGFESETKKSLLSPYNLATSINWLNAVVGDYPNFKIDFSKVLFSKGTIPVNNQVMVGTTVGGLKFSWDNSANLAKMSDNDHVMLMAYCPEKDCAFCQLDGDKRRVGFEEIFLPRYHETVLMHTYVAFISSDRKSISNSLYTGTVMW